MGNSSKILPRFTPKPSKIHEKSPLGRSWSPVGAKKASFHIKIPKKEPQSQPKGPPGSQKVPPGVPPKSPNIMKKAMQKYINFLTPSRTFKKTSFSLKLTKKLREFHPKSLQFRIRISILFLEGFS